MLIIARLKSRCSVRHALFRTCAQWRTYYFHRLQGTLSTYRPPVSPFPRSFEFICEYHLSGVFMYLINLHSIFEMEIALRKTETIFITNNIINR